MPHVFDGFFHHDQAVDAAAEGEAGVLLGIDIGGAQYIWMNHAATQKLNPAFAAADFTRRILSFTERTAERELKTRLGKWEIKRIDPDVEFHAVILLQKRL